MKYLLVIVFTVALQSAYAASVTTKTPHFAGGAVTTVTGLQIQSAELKVLNHFCSIGTCAGGPTEEKALKSKIDIAQNGESIQFASLRSDSFSTYKLIGNFSSCSVVLRITAKDADKKIRTGDGKIFYSTDQKACERELVVKHAIDLKLVKPMTIELWDTDRLLIK